MSVGTWLLSGYAPAAGVAAVTALTGRLPRLGARRHRRRGAARPGRGRVHRRAGQRHRRARLARRATGRCRSCSPGRRAMAAGGLGLLAAPAARVRAGPEPGAARRGHGDGRPGADDPPHGDDGRAVPRPAAAARTCEAAQILGRRLAAGARAVRDLRRCRRACRAGSPPRVSGAALLGASAATRWGVFHAGMASATRPEVHRRPAAAAAHRARRGWGGAGCRAPEASPASRLTGRRLSPVRRGASAPPRYQVFAPGPRPLSSVVRRACAERGRGLIRRTPLSAPARPVLTDRRRRLAGGLVR